MPFTLYINSGIRQDRHNTYYPEKRVITTRKGFAEAVCWDYVGAEYVDFKRSNRGFLSSDVVVMDLDNDDGQILDVEGYNSRE